jgi:hypothetical protein
MTSGPMGDEGLLTEEEAAAILQGWLAGEGQRSSAADNR